MMDGHTKTFFTSENLCRKLLRIGRWIAATSPGMPKHYPSPVGRSKRL
jgi:hypothetical protein